MGNLCATQSSTPVTLGYLGSMQGLGGQVWSLLDFEDYLRGTLAAPEDGIVKVRGDDGLLLEPPCMLADVQATRLLLIGITLQGGDALLAGHCWDGVTWSDMAVHGTLLKDTSLRAATLYDVRFVACAWDAVDLTEAKLADVSIVAHGDVPYRDVRLRDAELVRCSLTGAGAAAQQCDGFDLRHATIAHLALTNLRLRADFRGARIDGLTLDKVDFSHSLFADASTPYRAGSITLDAAQFLDSDGAPDASAFDRVRNGHSGLGGLLASLDTLPDPDVKHDLALQLVSLLRQSLWPLLRDPRRIMALRDFFDRAEFAHSISLRESVEALDLDLLRLFGDRVIGQGDRSQPAPDGAMVERMIATLKRLLHERDERIFAFQSVLLQLAARDAELTHAWHACAAVRPFLEVTADIIALNEEDYPDIRIFVGTDGTSAIVLQTADLRALLDDRPHSAWPLLLERLPTSDETNGEAPVECLHHSHLSRLLQLGQPFLERFYRPQRFEAVIDQLFAPVDGLSPARLAHYATLFESVLSGTARSMPKLVDHEAQSELHGCLRRFYDGRDSAPFQVLCGHLFSHAERCWSASRLDRTDRRTREATVLLTWAMIATRLSCAEFLGIELDSPLPVRCLAAAFVEAASARSKNVLSVGKRLRWRGKLLGQPGQRYACAQSLSKTMVRYAKSRTELLPMIRAVYPLRWTF